MLKRDARFAGLHRRAQALEQVVVNAGVGEEPPRVGEGRLHASREDIRADALGQLLRLRKVRELEVPFEESDLMVAEEPHHAPLALARARLEIRQELVGGDGVGAAVDDVAELHENRATASPRVALDEPRVSEDGAERIETSVQVAENHCAKRIATGSHRAEHDRGLVNRQPESARRTWRTWHPLALQSHARIGRAGYRTREPASAAR